LFKLFTVGVILGLAGAAAALYAFPVVDLERERSMVSVQPNGGNREAFYADLPADRILAGADASTFPDGIDWPGSLAGETSQTELFKLRNEAGIVVGVASRIAVQGTQSFVEWAVHLPARGSLYALLDGGAAAEHGRVGGVRAGTREFAARDGRVLERYTENDSDGNAGGRLELVTTLFGRAEALPEDAVPPAAAGEGA